MRKSILLVLMLGLSATAAATSGSPPARVAIAEGDFAAQRARIEAALADGKTYSEISTDDRATVRASLGRMSEKLEGVASIEELPEVTRVALFNDQEQVNTILTRAAEDSRVVCEFVQKTGSHRRTTHCETVADRRFRTERDQDRLRREMMSTPRLQNGG